MFDTDAAALAACLLTCALSAGGLALILAWPRAARGRAKPLGPMHDDALDPGSSPAVKPPPAKARLTASGPRRWAGIGLALLAALSAAVMRSMRTPDPGRTARTSGISSPFTQPLAPSPFVPAAELGRPWQQPFPAPFRFPGNLGRGGTIARPPAWPLPGARRVGAHRMRPR